MNDEQYLLHNLASLKHFAREFVQRTDSLEENDALRELAQAFQDLSDNRDDLHVDGRNLVSRLFVTYPDFSPTFPRELLWFLGGDCLHFMPDEEIGLYQQLEERREAMAEAGEIIDFAQERAKLLKLQ